MNSSPSNLAGRQLGMVGVAALVAMTISAGLAYWRNKTQMPEMSLAEALWITDSDYSRYYAPGSRESRDVAEALKRRNPKMMEMRFESHVLYRSEMTVDPDEMLLIAPFDPATIPPDKTAPLR